MHYRFMIRSESQPNENELYLSNYDKKERSTTILNSHSPNFQPVHGNLSTPLPVTQQEHSDFASYMPAV